MPDEFSPYGTHQHASPSAVHTHTLVGEPARLATLDQAVDGASRATFSTAPFKGGPKIKGPKPRRRRVDHGGVPLCMGMNDTCRQWALRGTNYCRHHDPKLRP